MPSSGGCRRERTAATETCFNSTVRPEDVRVRRYPRTQIAPRI
ncbi:hypothetical protein ACFPRL_23315 [Pseudoclavibacter helvolus]